MHVNVSGEKSPKISIVTPCFNQVDFLEATIQSVLSQNYSNLEYIIIDGGSIDGSLEIIKKYEKYLYFWCSEPDLGQYDALNKGFTHATGEVMAWLNSDDMYCPWALRTVSSIMSELPEVEWLTTLSPGYWDWHGFCKCFGSVSGYSRDAFLEAYYLPLLNKSAIGWIQQESTFWRRNLWRKVGSSVSTEYKLASDFDLWSRFYLYTNLYGVTSPLGGFRFQNNQRSRQVELYKVEAQKSLANMRAKLNWKPIVLREAILQAKLNRIPRIRKKITSLYGYVGKRVVRRELDSPDAYWAAEEYSFL